MVYRGRNNLGVAGEVRSFSAIPTSQFIVGFVCFLQQLVDTVI